jgi:NAD(P)-dependent dehydrogenase (short-subunit alcohol dehydrogenase family)
MGRAMALALAEAGADVMVADINMAGARATADEIAGLGRRALAVACDITDIRQIRAMFATLDEAWGRLDVLGNVAGPGFRCSAEEIDLETFERIIYGLTTARFCCCQEAGRRMLKQGRGSIINIGSIGGITALGRGNLAYSVGMGAVLQMTRELSTEWSGRGVRVNAILPAQVTNPGLQGYWVAEPAIKERMMAGIPIGRFGMADDIRGLALWLASDASAWITGALIPMDGGNLAMNAGGTAGPYKSAA